MIVETKKVVKFEENEKDTLRRALEIIENAYDEIDEEEFKYAIQDLQSIIYTEEWSAEE